MKNNTSHRIVGGLPLVYLLLTLFYVSLSAQTPCPTYPRMMDQVFVCLQVKDEDATLKLDTRASLYNPVRFVFPVFR